MTHSKKIEIAIWFGILALIISVLTGVKWLDNQRAAKPVETAVMQESGVTSDYKIPDPCYLKDVYCENEMVARITEYGWTGNRMANGEWPHIGAVASSDRTIALGTKVLIDGKEYTVKDRTAKWVDEKFEHPTFDIYSENPKGLKYSNVIIVK